MSVSQMDLSDYSGVRSSQESQQADYRTMLRYERQSRNRELRESRGGVFRRFMIPSPFLSARDDIVCIVDDSEQWQHQVIPLTSFRLPVPDAEALYANADLRRIFSECVDVWTRDTLFTSSATELVLHPAYQRIIGLGRQALPLLFEELKHRPSHWFWALRAITGTDAAEAEDTFEQAVQKWLAWGKETGHLA